MCHVQDTFDTRVCMSQTQKYTIDFLTASESELQDIIIPLTFDMQQTGHVHGLAFWFEVAFIGSECVLISFFFSVRLKSVCRKICRDCVYSHRLTVVSV